MDSLFDQNRQFLQTKFPGVWEAYQQSAPLPAAILDRFEIPLPNGYKLELLVDPKAYLEEHQAAVASMGHFSGALVWGVGTPDELELYWHSVPSRKPFLYVESDPAAFGKVLQTVRLEKLFSEEGCRLAFANDCGQLMSEMAVAFGDYEQVVSRISVVVSPRLFTRLLTDDHPLGWFNGFILGNVFLNQNEEEKKRGARMLSAGSSIRDVFPPAYLYQSILRFLKLYIIASPGIRTIYREMPGVADSSTVLPISIVILAWNRWDLTERCLRSIFALPIPKDTEILVVDNASTDVTPAALARLAEKIPQLRHIRMSRNLGPAGGRDAALQHARGKTLVFLDNDVEVKHERWLDILMEPFLYHPRIGACGAFGVLHTSDETEAWSQKLLFPGMIVPVSWISSFCVAVRKQALIDSGGWRPDLYPLYGMEDVSFGYSLRQAGWISVVAGQFVPVTHGMNHRDGHYDYDVGESGKKNAENFNRIWGERRRLLNPAKNNQTLVNTKPVTPEAQPFSVVR